MIDPKFIRNFAIVAHIDHGKSTLADRLLELTKTIDQRKMVNQILDSNPIERERGITIKLAPVRMKYAYDNQLYILNLIDTPGHVDFSYEVSRSLSACEGILLVVDAATGIQAQTVAHYNLIKKHNLKIIPVINKIDLPTANINEVSKQLKVNFQFKEEDIILISAKLGTNIDQILKAVIEKIPSPNGLTDNLRALVFSSHYDPHLGIIVYVRIKDGYINKTQNLENQKLFKFMASGAIFKPLEIGIFTPRKTPQNTLTLGEVGYIATGLKNIKLAQIGDTLINEGEKNNPLPGFLPPTPYVYLSLFPTDANDYLNLRQGLEKLQLSDCSITIKPTSSPMLGKGFLSGFLGLLHAEITRERLYREFNLNLITTIPTVEYQVTLKSGLTIKVKSPEEYPDPSLINYVSEPVMLLSIFTPKEYVGNIMQLCHEKRATFIDLQYFDQQAHLTYFMPLSEIIINFFDRLKSISSGFASLNYEFYQHQQVDIIKLDILINKTKAEAFSQLVVREKASQVANKLVNRLKELVPKHLFPIGIQAAIGGKIIARADISALKKDVTAKLYGGDRTRKDKLLDIQKRGKKKMKSLGLVAIPQEVFLQVHSSN